MNGAIISTRKFEFGIGIEWTKHSENSVDLNILKELHGPVLVGHLEVCGGRVLTPYARGLAGVLVLGIDSLGHVPQGEVVRLGLVIFGTDYTLASWWASGKIAALVTSKHLEGTDLISCHERSGT